MHQDDDEKALGIEQYIDVGSDYVVLHFPDMRSTYLTDDALYEMFIYPENLYAVLEPDQIRFWHTTIPEIIRVRERKRDLYEDMGFVLS